MKVGCGDGTEQFVTYRMLSGEGPFHMLLPDFLDEFKPYQDPRGNFVQSFPEPNKSIYDWLMEDDDVER